MRQGGEGSQERACYGQNRPHCVVPSWTVPYHTRVERSLGGVALRLSACPGVSAKGHGGGPMDGAGASHRVPSLGGLSQAVGRPWWPRLLIGRQQNRGR